MNMIVFDTSSEILIAGAGRPGAMQACSDAGSKHAQSIIPTLERCLFRAGLEKASLELVACCIGPGSFTGLRIGLATAKGLALAGGIPWVGVPTLDAFARAAEAVIESSREKESLLIVPILDARKKRLYSALYRGGVRLGDYLDISIEDLLARLSGEDEVCFAGPGADLMEDYCLERPGYRILPTDPGPFVEALAALAVTRFVEAGGEKPDRGPLYLREPEIG
jgi:tRNA threonylcarbamoyladenosine biosynthesis protein TsaB